MLDSRQSLVFYVDYSGIHLVYGVGKVWDHDSHQIHDLLRTLAQNTFWNISRLHRIHVFVASRRVFDSEKAAAGHANAREGVSHIDSRFLYIRGPGFLGTGTHAGEREKRENSQHKESCEFR